ncbi:ribosome small subunit-dependent GTPase A [Streptomyces sp. WMMC500]|uniref:ribosome small subunit-dependent GTPase A n=1 Tax=Streptomyces sp. WMMC500 TaxID=3015154 RepID=UPI00248C5FF1|nr:ribosome small subunit-dependent GTPase A [Streptomyces sp. WMMC500]WBB62218.1 ribosome small subunit-dependent GTPase A [Streptomyces sp. WMMC500]
MTHLPAPRRLVVYGWDEATADAFAPYESEGLIPARIARVDRGSCIALTDAGPVRATTARLAAADRAAGRTADLTRLPCTGDWAALEPGERFAVRALLPRRTAFLRSASSKRSEGQVIAANVDHAVIAVSLAATRAADIEPARLERLLSLAWSSGAQPLVALTKADLVEDPVVLGHLVDDTAEVAPGTAVLAVSAATGAGVPRLAAALSTGTSVLLGASGAGKSTLANALLGEDVQRVHEVRDADGKGRHTTVSRDLLPLPGGGVLIDTPGLRGVGLWEADDGLGQVFAEIEELAAHCRFHDCTHTAEPGCAVVAALENGELHPRRLDSYRRLQRENARIAARTDLRVQADRRREWKRRDAAEREARARKGRS